MTNIKQISLQLFLFIGLFMLVHSASSQTTIDSLKNELIKATNTNRIDVLNKIKH